METRQEKRIDGKRKGRRGMRHEERRQDGGGKDGEV